MFSLWAGEGVGTFTKPNLKKYAADLKLDTAAFNVCLDTEQTKAVIDADIAEVQRLGIQGTPTFLVNGRQLQIRTLDASEFSRTFDSFLK